MAPREKEIALRVLLNATDNGEPSVRMDAFPAEVHDAIMQVYHLLGGRRPARYLIPSGWDILLEDGTFLEFDEDQHFNRYRAMTFAPSWASSLPWANDYMAYSRDLESAVGRSGNWWRGKPSSDPDFLGMSVPESHFGKASRGSDFSGNGAPRWKLRAVYDMMRDATVLHVEGRKMARLSVHDVIGGVPLGISLGPGAARPDPDKVMALIANRSFNR